MTLNISKFSDQCLNLLNPNVNVNIELMTSKEYEIFIKNLFQILAKDENLKEVEFYHNKRYQGLTRTWDVDVSYNFVLNKFKFLVFVECKYWNKRVEADEVSLMLSCLNDCGAQKGVIATTVGFQSGALKAAKKLGIGLLIVNDIDKTPEYHNFTGDELNFEFANETPVYSSSREEKRSAGIVFPQHDFYLFMKDMLGIEIVRIISKNDYSPLYSLSRKDFEIVYNKINTAMDQYRLLESGGLPLELKDSPVSKHYWALQEVFVQQMFDS